MRIWPERHRDLCRVTLFLQEKLGCSPKQSGLDLSIICLNWNWTRTHDFSMIYPSAMRANSSMGPTFFVVGKSKGADVPFHEGSAPLAHWPFAPWKIYPWFIQWYWRWNFPVEKRVMDWTPRGRTSKIMNLFTLYTILQRSAGVLELCKWVVVLLRWFWDSFLFFLGVATGHFHPHQLR